ncbi:MAG TPA: hypothetical protein VK509_24910 [Polyangiales bacterium]|nr:hypothetical protein [Polyangiales bacterium]
MIRPLAILTCGGPGYAECGRVFSVLDEINEVTPVSVLMHGACGWDADNPGSQRLFRLEGADRIAEDWARVNGIKTDRWLVRSRYGHGSRIVRDTAMVMMLDHRRRCDGHAALVLAFPDAIDTTGTVAFARHLLLPVREIRASSAQEGT